MSSDRCLGVGLVSDHREYRWSSYLCYGLRKVSELQTPHPKYQALGDGVFARQASYRALFMMHLDVAILKEIRGCIQKGPALNVSIKRKGNPPIVFPRGFWTIAMLYTNPMTATPTRKFPICCNGWKIFRGLSFLQRT